MSTQTKQGDEFRVITPAEAQTGDKFSLDALVRFATEAQNYQGFSLGDLLAKGRTLAIARKDAQGNSVDGFALYTVLDDVKLVGLIALRCWHYRDTPVTYEDIVIQVASIEMIKRPTPDEVRRLFTRVCSHCSGTGQLGSMNQPCDKCEGTGEFIEKNAKRVPLSWP